MSVNILGSEWQISPEGLNIITENGIVTDFKKVLKYALDSDLKQIGKSVLTNEISNEKIQKLVLQIQKIRNVSAPKANENSQAAPRMLKLTLTDGHTSVQAIEISPVQQINRDKTPPGTKILVNNVKMSSGYLLIGPNNCTVLGGEVPHLIDKWILAKSVQQNRRTNNIGAPAWVNFGQKIEADNQDNSFKSLVNKDTNKDNTEFEQQRQEAIAEAATGAVRKTFGGRVKQNVQPIVTHQNKKPFDRSDRSKRSKNIRGEEEEEEKLQRPSDKVSLFSFLEDKLPANETNNKGQYNKIAPTAVTGNNYQPSYGQFKNQHSSSNKQNSNSKTMDSQSIQRRSNYQENRNRNTDYPMPNQHNVNNSYNQNQYNGTNYPSSGHKYQNPQYDRQGSSNYQKQHEKPYQNPRPNFNRSESFHTSQNFKHTKNTEKPPFQTNREYGQQTISNTARQNEKPYQTRQNFNQQQYQSNASKQHQQNPKDINSSNKQHNENKSQSQTVNDVTDNLAKMSVNSEFASRSFRQHLNLGPSKKTEERKETSNKSGQINIGNEVLAKYWEDNQYYNAVVVAITEKTYVVKFKGYENIEEVLKTDCLPANRNSGYNQNRSQNMQYHGSMEFHRRK